MKINDVRVDGFGVWSNLTLDQLSPEVTLFFGPNEAGKTTLMQMVRAVLYGYSPERRGRYLPPVFGGKPGGSLVVQGSRGRFTIDRRADRGDANGLGKVVVQGESGSAQGQHLLSMMLSGVDESIFNNVFAVGLREIQELGTLTGTQAASHLFALTAGMDRVSLVDVMRELREKRAALVATEGEHSLSRLIADRDKLSAEVKQLRGTTSKWVELVGQLTASESDTKDAEAEVAELEHQLRVVELADRIRERWLEQQYTQGEIDLLEPIPYLPDDAVARYDGLTTQINAQQTLCDDWKAQWMVLRDQARELPINEGLRRNCCRVEALGEQEPWLNSIREHIHWLHEEISNVETDLFTEREALGLGDGFDWDRLPEVRDHAEGELSRYWQAINTAQSHVEKTREEVANQRQNAKQLDEKFDSALTVLGEDDLQGAIEKAGEHVANLHRRTQLDERMASLGRHRTELAEEGDDLAEEQVLSFNALAFVGLLFCSGFVLLLTGLMYEWFPLTQAGGWICGLAGVGLMLGSMILKGSLERMAANRVEDCDEELDRVVRQLKKARKEADDLDAILPAGSGPLASQVHEAEQTLARLEELVPMDGERIEARGRDESAQARARQAAADLKTARNNWREALAEASLPEDLTAEQMQLLVKRCDHITLLHDRLDSRRDELEKRNAELLGLTTRINRLSDDVGIKARTREPMELLHSLVSEHTDQQGLLKQRDELRKQGKELKAEYTTAARQVRKLTRLQRDVLHEANVAGEDELRSLAAQVARYGELVVRRDQLETEIDSIIGEIKLDEIAIELQSGDKEAITARYEAISNQLAEAESRLKELYLQRGRLSEQVKVLEADRRLPEAQMELACVEAKIKQSARQWRTLAATGVVLESVRHIYETERQPATLSDASKYLEKMTEGRYLRVWTPLDEDTLLVDDAHGNSLPIGVLSAGTREQVFLAIRLALVAMYSRRGAVLPLVLDDVLVNCDAVRTRSAAKVMCDFAAEGHQLLIFTCHEHIMRIFQMQHADVRKLPVRSELGASELDEIEEEVIEPEVEEEESIVDILDHLTIEEPEPEEELIEELDDEIFEVPEPEPEPEPVAEIEPEPEPMEYVPQPVYSDDTWQEDIAPDDVDDEPFAALLQTAGSKRSSWTPSEQHAWDEAD